MKREDVKRDVVLPGPMSQSRSIVLTQASLATGVRRLAEIDRDLARIVATYGDPPLWARQPGFPTLIHIILEQQVSLASARAAFNRLHEASVELTPERFLQFNDDELRGFGFSRQKALYGREVSRAILSGDLDLDGLPALDDEAVRQQLMQVKGIGRWTADIYLLMALLRADVWPVGDLALVKAVKEVKELPPGSTLDTTLWKPWRAVAARIFWHHYLNTR